MNELPRDARAMLALAKDAHDPPDPHARERVRTKVLAAVAIAPVGLSVGAAQLGKPSISVLKAWFGSKTALASALLLLAVGGTLTGLQTRSRSTSTQVGEGARPATRPEASTGGSLAPAAAAPPPSASSLQSAPGRSHAPRAAAKSASVDLSLRAEVSLLSRATEQLEQGDSHAALRSLAEHRRRFAHTQLAPEREGLEVLARCQQSQPHAAQAGRAYLARNPTNVLKARIEQACER